MISLFCKRVLQKRPYSAKETYTFKEPTSRSHPIYMSLLNSVLNLNKKQLSRALQHTATHTTTHCNKLQLTTTHCNTLQHTATHCNTLQHTATHYNTQQQVATYYNTLQHTTTHCNKLQLTTTHCNTLQHTATQKRNCLAPQSSKVSCKMARH